MIEQVAKRLDTDKKKAKALIKAEEKKNKIRLEKLKKKKQQAGKAKDSIPSTSKK
jgi:hypothetical protein